MDAGYEVTVERSTQRIFDGKRDIFLTHDYNDV